MVLVDTSCWVEALRATGKTSVRERLATLLRSGTAAWCDAVKLELWNGRAGEAERKRLNAFDAQIPTLETTAAVWKLSLELAGRASEVGLTFPAMDLLIVACGRHHGVPVESCDAHFIKLESLR